MNIGQLLVGQSKNYKVLILLFVVHLNNKQLIKYYFIKNKSHIEIQVQAS